MLDDPSCRCTLFVFWPLLYCNEKYQIHTYATELLATFVGLRYYMFITTSSHTWSVSGHLCSPPLGNFLFQPHDYFTSFAIDPVCSTHQYDTYF